MAVSREPQLLRALGISLLLGFPGVGLLQLSDASASVGPFLVSCAAFLVGFVFVLQRLDTLRRRGRRAALARAHAVGDWTNTTPANVLAAGTEGILALHADRIGFFPLFSTDDLVVPRAAILSMSAISNWRSQVPVLRIQWEGKQLETRLFAGPDLSPWTGNETVTAVTEPPALPRAIATLRDEA